MPQQAKRKDHRDFSLSAVFSIVALANSQSLGQKPQRGAAVGLPNYCCLFINNRTCNQTVTSGGISIGFADFAGFSFDFYRVRSASFTSFLVRNWCGVR